VTTLDGGHLRLPEGVKWPHAKGGTLFKRRHYEPLLKDSLEMLRRKADPLEHRHIVAGRWGTGTTTFGWYAIYRILTEQPERTVVYIHDCSRTTTIIVRTPPGADGTRGALVLELQGITYSPIRRKYIVDAAGTRHPLVDPVVVADSLVPPLLTCPTLVTSYTGRLESREWTNRMHDYDAVRVLPTPDEKEIWDMHRVLVPHLDVAGVEQRMRRAGPVPRWVLVDIDRDDYYNFQ
jgi:hypothetical protein